MPFQNDILGGSSGQGGAYTIDQSVRFDDGDSAYLSRTPSSAGNQKTFTLSFWTKRCSFDTGDDQMYLAGGTSSGVPRFMIGFGTLSPAKFRVGFNPSGSSWKTLDTTAVYRDPGAWLHIVVAVDTTQATASNRTKLYINGEQVTAFDNEDYVDQNDDLPVNSIIEHRIGANVYSDYMYLNSYLAEYYFIDGQQLDADDFGETNPVSNQWIPKDASTLTFGTNGFYQKYANTELNSIVDAREPAQFVPSANLTCDVLIVAGGGGGESVNYGGGGGGGGMRAITGVAATSGTSYPIEVGLGGAQAWWGANRRGQDSSAFGYTSTGGGTGGYQGGAATYTSGGSGGGAGGTSAAGIGNTPSTSPSQGANGGTGNSSGAGGGGGGGGGGGASGSTGSNGGISGTTGTGGNGGAGTSNDYRTGSGVVYAGGGGAAVNADGTQNVGVGGNGGGGNGESSGVSASTAGTNGLGGGGGGGTTAGGKYGGSGIVVIRYLAASAQATGGTITTYGAGGSQYYVHSFTTGGEAPLGITENGDVQNTRALKKVGDSSIKFDGTGDYLTVPAAAGQWEGAALTSFSFTNYTVECWFYVNAITGNDQIMGNTNDAYYGWNIQVDDSGPTVGFQVGDGGGSWDIDTVTSGGYSISTGQWYHVAMVRDDEDWTLYVDGTSRATGTFALSASYSGRLLYIGNGGTAGGGEFNGYMDEIRISDSSRYTDTFTPQTTEFTVDANTLLLIHSNWNGGFGADSSGNSNTFSATNLVATDQMVDTPTNNFATFNPLIEHSGSGARMSYTTLTEGNLLATGNYASETGLAPGTFSFGTGKWYVEFVATSLSGAYPHLGIIETTSCTSQGGYATNSVMYKADGGKVQNSTNTGGVGASWVAGDVIGMAVDCTNGAVYFAKNNAWQNSGDPTSGASKTGAFMTWTGESIDFVTTTSPYTTSAGSVMNCGQDSSFAGEKTAQGNQDGNDIGDFYYTPPTGFLALCTSNLSDPSIKLPDKHFNTLLYDDGAGAKTGLGFQPDMVWVKARGATNDHKLTDSLRGVEEALTPNTTAAQTTYNQGLLAFGSDGFTVGTDDHFDSTTGTGMASWSWKAATTFDPTTDGDIAVASGQSNATAGFSIVRYTGENAAKTIGHGLSTAPKLIIVKNLGVIQWPTFYIRGDGSDGVAFLDQNGVGEAAGTAYWNDTIPTASVFTVGNSGNTGGLTSPDYIAYCFADVEGYSKIGLYEGNNNADGPMVYLGFRPAWLLIKNTDSTEPWVLSDNKRSTYNIVTRDLQPSTYNTEATGSLSIDYVSNGFKLRSNNATMNTSKTFLYMAIAESPFKTANAR